jgi:hypothetical protein
MNKMMCTTWVLAQVFKKIGHGAQVVVLGVVVDWVVEWVQWHITQSTPVDLVSGILSLIHAELVAIVIGLQAEPPCLHCIE